MARTTTSTLQHTDSTADTQGGGLSVDDQQSLHRLFEEVYSKGRLSVVDELVAPGLNGYCTGMGKTVEGVSGLKAHAARLRSTFTGLDIRIDDLRRTSDGFVARLSARGRFERVFGGIQPRCVIGPAGEEPHGPRVTVSGIVTGSMSEGRLIEWDFDWDFGALRNQD